MANGSLPSGHQPRGCGQVFYGWWIVWAGFFITVYIGCIIFYGITAFFEPLVREFGWSYTQISLASSLRGLEMSILAPLFGFLVDRYGARRMVFGGVITVGLGILLLSRTNSLWAFYAAFILIGFGGGGCTTVVLTGVVANWFQRDIGKAVALLASGYGAIALCFVDFSWVLLLFLVFFPAGFGGAMVLRAAIIREEFGQGTFGRLFGIALGTAAVGGVIGPTLTGLVYDVWGTYLYAWIGLALAAALATLLMLISSRSRKAA